MKLTDWIGRRQVKRANRKAEKNNDGKFHVVTQDLNNPDVQQKLKDPSVKEIVIHERHTAKPRTVSNLDLSDKTVLWNNKAGVEFKNCTFAYLVATTDNKIVLDNTRTSFLKVNKATALIATNHSSITQETLGAVDAVIHEDSAVQKINGGDYAQQFTFSNSTLASRNETYDSLWISEPIGNSRFAFNLNTLSFLSNEGSFPIVPEKNRDDMQKILSNKKDDSGQVKFMHARLVESIAINLRDHGPVLIKEVFENLAENLEDEKSKQDLALFIDNSIQALMGRGQKNVNGMSRPLKTVPPYQPNFTLVKSSPQSP